VKDFYCNVQLFNQYYFERGVRQEIIQRNALIPRGWPTEMGEEIEVSEGEEYDYSPLS